MFRQINVYLGIDMDMDVNGRTTPSSFVACAVFGSPCPQVVRKVLCVRGLVADYQRESSPAQEGKLASCIRTLDRWILGTVKQLGPLHDSIHGVRI